MRLFFALDLPAADKRHFAAIGDLLRERGIRGSFAREHNLHLTLRFLGETSSGRTQALQGMLAGLKVNPFTLHFTHAGRFRRKDGDILWLGAEPDDVLRAVHETLTRALERLGYPREPRPFTPHLTIARRAAVPQGFDWRQALEQALPRPVPVDGIRLLRTEFVPGGVRYHEIGRSG